MLKPSSRIGLKGHGTAAAEHPGGGVGDATTHSEPEGKIILEITNTDCIDYPN